MIRLLLYHIVPLLLPFVAYALYLMATKRAREHGEVLEDTPWYWLFISGLVLTGISILFYWYVIQEPAGGTYVPPHVQDGTIVPGRIIRE